MGKAKAHPDQIGFCFELPRAASGPASLAGLERRISVMIGSVLNSDPRSRRVIAALASELLDDDVSEDMLNAYASPAREGHKVIMSRALAIIAVCERQDLLDSIMREIGCALLVGEEIHTARIGHIDRAIEQLKEERRRIAGQAPLIRGGRTP